MVIAGELPPGSRINEVHLAEALAVSRTPLREALNQLTAEGDVVQVPRRGFFVCPLTIEEAEEIYPIRAYLDPEALRLSGVPEAARLETLDKLSGQIQSAKSIARRIELENKWFMTLYADCPNETLLHLIEQFMRRTARYEMVSMAEGETIRQGSGTRAAVTAALRKGDMDHACALLRDGLMRGKHPVIDWLTANPVTTEL
jgi:DNA-binding GntR family transcriptional regulator